MESSVLCSTGDCGGGGGCGDTRSICGSGGICGDAGSGNICGKGGIGGDCRSGVLKIIISPDCRPDSEASGPIK